MPELSKTDMQKAISYLDDAADLYDALPMQKMKCRAHMIRQLTAKLKSRLSSSTNTTNYHKL
ncbi:MAG: hypothetical protein K2J42_11330 [Muribaculaceae bacterium]|nr:hypothetical protein [Muribaculaceae bacterium]